MKVVIPNELSNWINEEEIIRKHERNAKGKLQKQYTAELIVQGVDKEIAKAMTKAFWVSGL